jgi:hypothetical protein
LVLVLILRMRSMLARLGRSPLALALLVVPALAQGFAFVALGDLPYGSPRSAYPPYRQLIASINAHKPVFSIHVGDITSGGTLCSDEEFAAQRAHFDQFDPALIYTPGDNEWTDCHRPSNGSYRPQERLGALRALFFPARRSLGMRPLALQSQSELMPEHAQFVENQRWLHAGVLFLTVHVVGSNNNMQTEVPGAMDEYARRDAANTAWLQAGFEYAQRTGARAIVLAMQANPLLGRNLFEDFPKGSGFRSSIGDTLLPLAAASSVPVLLIHGDSHWHRMDQPFSWQRQPLRQLTRLEVPGGSDVRAWRVSVDPSKPQPFSAELIEPQPGP